jgi:hypothetical protein
MCDMAEVARYSLGKMMLRLLSRSGMRRVVSSDSA